MGTNKINTIGVLIVLCLVSCERVNNNKCNEIPTIVVKKDEDTLSLGDTLRAIISLSDTTLLAIDNKEGVIEYYKPNVYLGDEKLFVGKFFNSEVKFAIDSVIIKKYYQKGSDCLLFPIRLIIMNPNPNSGEVTLEDSFVVKLGNGIK